MSKSHSQKKKKSIADYFSRIFKRKSSNKIKVSQDSFKSRKTGDICNSKSSSFDNNVEKEIKIQIENTSVADAKESNFPSSSIEITQNDSIQNSKKQSESISTIFEKNKLISNKNEELLLKKQYTSQESSEDSDFSADSTEDSFEESSEDENVCLIENETNKRTLKDDYFTKGKYITYFFLEMERQGYDPSEVYCMVQYHDSNDCENPEKKGIKQ